MQILVLGLMTAILLHDQFGPAPVRLNLAGFLALFLAAPLLLGILHHLLCRWTLGQLSGSRGHAALHRRERLAALLRPALFLPYLTLLILGGLTFLRQAIGDLILLDELLFLTPPLLLLLALWWSYYPIDRRLREASLLSHLDAGRPVYPIWSRGQYLLAQTRHQLALVGLPLLLLMTWSELVQRYVPPDAALLSLNLQWACLLAGTAGVYLLAPVMLRHVWDTQPLPAGTVRDLLTHLCRQQRVGVREILLWRTFGGTINAAVMGLLAPFRYILLTDALLDLMPAPQVEAVMAHELAHIRKHHMFWLIASAAGMLAALQLLWLALLHAATRLPGMAPLAQHLGFSLAEPLLPVVLALLCWLPVFGWISRRFERQADAFAVQHLARQAAGMPPDATVLLDTAAVATMRQALQTVAELNCLSTQRHSWRHGSIAWRQNYLDSLVGTASDAVPVDRQVALINLTSLALLLGSFAVEGLLRT